jgi:hypothetical protein
VDYLSAHPFGYPAITGGTVPVPAGPGIGAAPDPEVIERSTVWERSIGRSAT